jgi:hypothetical protein
MRFSAVGGLIAAPAAILNGVAEKEGQAFEIASSRAESHSSLTQASGGPGDRPLPDLQVSL